MELEHELEVAEAVARETGEVLLARVDPGKMGARAKGERDVVTAADFAGEAHSYRRLNEAFPEDGIIGEEGSRLLANAGRRWCIDPLDGTVNYAHGIPLWCVSISLFEGSQPVLGVVHDPLRGETFSAARYLGARCNGASISTSGRTRPADAMVHITVDFREESLHSGLEDLTALAPRVLRTRNLGSAALALSYVAAGRLDAMLHRHAYPWDYGAGIVLVQEAGGAATGIAGEQYSVDTSAVAVAATEPLRAILVEVIREGQDSGLE